MSYFRLLWKKAYLGVLIILLCACLGSIRGAFKEDEPGFSGVPQADINDMEQAGVSAPELTGVMPLAAEQNRWHNFSYALHYAGRGVILYGILMAVYVPLYHCRIFKGLRSLLEGDSSAGRETEWEETKR